MIRQRTVVEQVLNSVKESVANGKFSVGDKIPTEPELAQLFGIGRSSVREAIKILQYLGVLEVRPSKGTFVSETTNLLKEVLSWTILLGEKDFFELIELRKTIEKAALEDFIIMKGISEKKWNKLIIDLETSCENMRLSETPDMFIEHDYVFHGAIMEGSGNSVYIDIYRTLTAFMHKEIKMAIWDWIKDIFVNDRGEIEASLKNVGTVPSTRIERLEEYNERMHMHVSILNAIKERNLADAVMRLDAHITGAKKAVETYFQKGVSDNRELYQPNDTPLQDR